MHGKRFDGGLERLRATERIARLEIERVIGLAMEGVEIHQVLDVGAGTGLFSEAFVQAGCQVTGLDVNPDMLAAARQIVPGADFREGLAESLPFPARSSDLVFFGLVLHETDDLYQALKEARRVARLRAAALEWPYQMSEFGPPLEHRLRPKVLRERALQAGFGQVEMVPLKHLLFYRME
ncbi:MAG: methyltransferase domain-containing protein [Anaerolineales bacterium]|jgi:ubiquinone/menaquinone biosynthesis C-methylase UbiE